MTEATAFLEFTADWPDPVERLNSGGSSPIVLLCEHASRHVPAEYAGLGLAAADMERHIAWDIGAADVTRRLSARLDAAAFLGTYSRLLIDLNRPPHVPASIPGRSEATDIPANLGLPSAERGRRIERIFAPFHRAVTEHLDRRTATGRPTVLVSIHSFTPVYLGRSRPWDVGVLFGGAQALGERLVRRLNTQGAFIVGSNQPYRVTEQEDYAIPEHGDARGIPAVLIEIRNDGLDGVEGIVAWTDRLAEVLASEAAEIAS